jgi:arabinogalactan oligomer/maltooligosaccharide transport system substrate-binding protein
VQGCCPLTLDRRKGGLYASLHQCLPLDNALYGVPKAVETLVLIYNKDLIDKPLDSLQAWLDYSKSSASRTNTACWPSLTRSITAGALLARWAAISSEKRQGGFNRRMSA